jgi:dynein light intermediate chain 1
MGNHFASLSFTDHTRLGVWTLDGDPHHQNLLRFALKEDNFHDTTVALVTSMTTPWNIMDQLQNWATILQDHIDNLALTAEKTKQWQNESKTSL